MAQGVYYLMALHSEPFFSNLPDDIEALQEKFDWNARVFTERQDNIPLACEIPVEIEQRAFAVGRTIRFHMS